MVNATATLPVIIHEIKTVSNVPTALQLIDFTILRIGFSELFVPKLCNITYMLFIYATNIQKK